MNIGIIGTGNMGSGLGKRFAAAGERVMFGSRNPEKSAALAASVGSNAQGGSYAEAAKFGEVVVLAVPWRGVDDAIKAAGSLAGKIVIDVTNPMTPDYMQLVVGFNDSAAEHVARLAVNARVVKAFNHVYAQIIHSSPQFGSQNATVLYCGDDAAAKKTVAGLIERSGFEPVDAGSLQNARYFEPFAELMVQLAYAQGMGTDQAFKLVRRAPVTA